MHFRTDINGLRAIAVTLVVLFHFGVPGITAGFIGVDVFFVISGFLMTGIIVSRREERRFRLLDFYLDRCRRIIPALAVLCLVLMVVGGFLMLAGEYVNLGRQVIAAMTFMSNVLFWKSTGYFQEAAEDQWLLHTWSLSVEWQFYLLYPILLLPLSRYLPRASWRWLILGAALMSFAISLLASFYWASGAFYLLPARAWEMLAGALVYLFPLRVADRARPWLAWAGLSLIAFATWLATPDSAWPGYLALLPVGGALLFLVAAHESCWLTRNRVAQFIGKTSYSLYLWHWPFAVWLGYFSLEHRPWWIALAIAASVGAGYLSYRFIETPALQRGGRIRRAPQIVKLGAAFGIVGLGMMAIVTDGLPGRLPAEFRSATYQLSMPMVTNGWCFYSVESIATLPIGQRGQRCELGAPHGRLRALLIGDSFAGHYGPFWDAIGKRTSINIQSVSSDWCFPSSNGDYTGPRNSRGYQQCLVNREYLKSNAGDYDLVIFAGSWGVIDSQAKLDGVRQAIRATAGKTPLLVIMPTPTNFDVNVADRYARSLLFDLPFDISRFGKTRDAKARKANSELEALAGTLPDVLYLPREALFNIDGLPSDVTRDNIPFGLDESGHISVYGSRQAAEAFRHTATFEALRRRLLRIQ